MSVVTCCPNAQRPKSQPTVKSVIFFNGFGVDEAVAKILPENDSPANAMADCVMNFLRIMF